MLRRSSPHISLMRRLRMLGVVLSLVGLAAPCPSVRAQALHGRTTRQRKHRRHKEPQPRPEVDELADLPMPDLGGGPIAKPVQRAKPAPKLRPQVRRPPPPADAEDDGECDDDDDEECDDEESDASEPEGRQPEAVLAAAPAPTGRGPMLASADLGLVVSPSPAVRKRVQKSRSRRPQKDEADEDDDDDSAFSLAAEVDSSSRYQWHGLTVVDGPTLQPAARAAYRGFELATAVSMPFAPGSSSRVADLSAELAHSTKLGPYTLRPSLEGMLFPGQALPSTAELGFSVAAKIHGPFSLVTTHHVDALAHPGAYFGEMGFQFAPELSKTLSLETQGSWGVASAGFNDAYFGVDRFTLNVVEGRAQLTWAPVDPFYVGPHAEFAVLVDRELRSAEPHAEQLVVGLVGGCLW